jgi:D-sedoheptulose 7-phosphate isomerase
MSVRRSGSTVFIAGNGGSASTASHISLDWMLGPNLVNPPLRVISLVDSTASITATGNDIAFLDIFSRPLRALAQEGDLLVVVSASGNSPNLVSLVETARDKGVRVAAITGFDGGRLAKAADLSIHVATEIGDYGVAEDIHLMIGHMVKEALLEER